MDAIKLNTAQARPIVKATFPDYRGRKFSLEFTDRVCFYNVNWSGGSKNEYRLVNIDGRVGSLIGVNAAPWDNPVEGQTMDLMPDVLVVKHVYFCGKDLGITIYAHYSLAPKFLTA